MSGPPFALLEDDHSFFGACSNFGGDKAHREASYNIREASETLCDATETCVRFAAREINDLDA